MSELITSLAAIFLLSSVILVLTQKFSQPSIPGYILAGILLSYIGIEISTGFIEIGAAFLIFIFGLKTEPERLKTVATDSLTTTIVVGGIAGCLAYIISYSIGFNMIDSIFIGIAGAASSSLIGMQLVKEEIRADVLHGILSESIHLMQDIGVVLLILLFSGLITGEGFSSILATAAILIAALGMRSNVLPLIESKIEESRELAMLTALSILTGFIAVGNQLGVYFFASAFAAGLSLSKFPYNMETLETLGPAKDFFSAGFFVAVGTLVDFPTGSALTASIGLIIISSITKPLLTGFYLLFLGHDSRTSYLTGFSLDQVGEFPLILAVEAFVAGTISAGSFHAITAAAAVTMAFSSYTSKHDERLYAKIKKIGISENNEKIAEKSDVEELNNHIILVGFDSQGRELAEQLNSLDEEFVVIDNNPDKIMEARERYGNFVFGDIMDDETWEKARVRDADLIISTVPLQNVSDRINSLDYDVEVFLRAQEPEEAKRLLENGADFVELPDLLAAEELESHIEGIMEDKNYREELRRRNLLEIRRHLNVEEEE